MLKNREEQKRWPVSSIALTSVTERKGAVRFALDICKSPRSRFSDEHREATGVAQVDLARALQATNTSILCLDDVDLADVDYYLNARKERADYLNFIDLLMATREVLAAENEVLDPVRRAINDLTFTRIQEPKERQRAIEKAIRIWRRNNKGAIPGRTAEFKTISKIAVYLATEPEALVARIKDKSEYALLDIRVDGDGILHSTGKARRTNSPSTKMSKTSFPEFRS